MTTIVKCRIPDHLGASFQRKHIPVAVWADASKPPVSVSLSFTDSNFSKMNAAEVVNRIIASGLDVLIIENEGETIEP